MTMAETIRITRPRQMPPVHPGVILRDDVLPALNISVSAAARQLGLLRQTLHRILAGQLGVSTETALRCGRGCNRPLTCGTPNANWPTRWPLCRSARRLDRARLEKRKFQMAIMWSVTVIQDFTDWWFSHLSLTACTNRYTVPRYPPGMTVPDGDPLQRVTGWKDVVAVGPAP